MNSFHKISTTQMTSFSLLFINLLFSLLITQFPVTTSHGCHEQDRRALLDFKSSLADPADRLSSWKDSYQHQNCCNWHGVACSYDSFRVISVDLRNRDVDAIDNDSVAVRPSTSLTGIFSPSLFNIRHLEYIDLAHNDFQKTQIPLGLSNLTKLSHLDLSNSNIGSSISSQFNNLSSLHHLDLSWNYDIKLSSIKWLTGLVNLQVLNLSGIDLHGATSSEGKFAGHISHLSNLIDLDLSDCRLSSLSFPNFHNLSFLSSLKMSDNSDFNFSIPAQLANLTSLSTLELSRCDLQGSIPYLPQLKELDVSYNPFLSPDLTRMFQHQWPKLQTLSMSFTNIRGSIPDSISNAPVLVSFDAIRCSIQGSLPSSVYNLSQLQSLFLSANNITGNIHSSISNLRLLYILDLSGNNLQGSIPKSISNLKLLTSLDLSDNNLQGSIPEPISNIQSLIVLDLSINKIQGSIPSSICKIHSLRELSLQSNNITGTIPSCISKLHNLTDFSVYDNSVEGSVSLILLIKDLEITTIELSSDRLDVSIDRNLRLYSKFKLEYLGLPPGNLKGLFPTIICKLNYLRDLKLSHSQLKGVIPSCICKLKNLNTLELSHNQLTGVFPSCVSKLKNLNTLDLSQNHLTGVIPSCISNLKKLEIFNVSSNNFYGHLPLPPQTVIFDASNNKLSGEFSLETGINISRFQVINLAGNELSGSIPSSICSKHSESYLRIIDLSNNKFSGVIPKALGYCRDLDSLNLGSNNLTGNVPNELEHLELLGYLQLQDNCLDGSPLSFISKLRGLVVVNLADNHFEGSIPISLFGPQYSRLSILSLRSNKFNGSIPDEINNLDQLQILDLSHNNFSGHIPKQLGGYWMNLTGNSEMLRDEYDIQLQMVINGIMVQYQKVYTYDSGLDLSCNMLDGNIPTELGRLEGLRRLNLSHNNLSESIPASIGDIYNLVSLDLSFNKLSGRIPESMTSLDSLGVLNLSYNELSGEIPNEIHFNTLGADGWAYVGNALLCGEAIKKVGEAEENDQEDDQEDPNEKLILYSITSLGFVVGFWGLFFVMLIKKEKWWFPYWRLIDSVVDVIISCIQDK